MGASSIKNTTDKSKQVFSNLYSDVSLLILFCRSRAPVRRIKQRQRARSPLEKPQARDRLMKFTAGYLDLSKCLFRLERLILKRHIFPWWARVYPSSSHLRLRWKKATRKGWDSIKVIHFGNNDMLLSIRSRSPKSKPTRNKWLLSVYHHHVRRFSPEWYQSFLHVICLCGTNGSFSSTESNKIQYLF